jgi:tRNA pseudouridine55 synthase
MNGIIIIDKPQEWTSNDVVSRLRRVFNTRRIGHGGTLDPMATGVLPVFVGRATRGVEFFEHAQKVYETTIRFGLTTDTEDITGKVLTENQVSLTEDDLLAVLPRFRGDILQVPPMYSAIKVNGQKLYDLARKGKEVERKPRSITIYELELLEQTADGDYILRCLCSKGTYVRTLCHDIGQALGCGGAMSSLRRTMAAGFPIDRAVTVEDVQEKGEALLLPLDAYFENYPAYRIPSPKREARVRNGNPITDPALADGLYRVYGADGTFLCLSEAKDGVLTAVKNFFGT